MRVFARPVGCAHARSSPRVFALSTRSNSRSSSSSRVTRAAARPSERLARLTAAASKMLWKGCADPSKCATVESLVEILLPWESNSLCAPGRLIKVNTRQGTHTSSPTEVAAGVSLSDFAGCFVQTSQTHLLHAKNGYIYMLHRHTYMYSYGLFNLPALHGNARTC